MWINIYNAVQITIDIKLVRFHVDKSSRQK